MSGQRNTVNYFRKMRTDIDERNLEQDVYEDLVNGHPYRYDGKGGVITTFRGMEEKFTLPDGFIPIGYTAYNGILYLVLLDDENNEVEIGSYPSPDYDLCDGTWLKQYGALKNYTRDVNYNLPDYVNDCGDETEPPPTYDFRLSNELIGWSCTRRLSMFGHESYDGSLNLYIADGEIPNHVINTGFHHQTGVCLRRYVSELDFTNGNLVQFNESGRVIKFDLESVDGNGKLKAGHYIFFARYNNQNRATTSFIASSGPVMIAASPQSGTGGQPDTFGGEYNLETNKSVTLRLTGVDTSYQRLELGFIYFSGGFNESYIIENDYYINGQALIDITITGYETISAVENEEFLNIKPVEKACLSHTEVNNIYYGANWKGRTLHHPDLCEFASCIVIGEEKVVLGGKDFDYTAIPTNGQYNGFNTEKQVYYDTGYFSGETYAFRIHPVFTNGQIGLGYGMQGGDNFTGVIPPATVNTDGIYRFSSPVHDGFVQWAAGQPEVIWSKKAKFDFSGCATTAWIDENVLYWVISRAERKENLLYQGVATKVYDGKIIVEDDYYHTGWKGEEIAWNETKWAPLINGLDHFMYRKGGTGSEQITRIFYGYGGSWNNPTTHRVPEAIQENKYGVFSADFMLDNANGVQLPSGGYMVNLGGVLGPTQGTATENNGPTESVVANTDIAAWNYPSWAFPTGGNRADVKLYDVNPWDYTPNNGFISRIDNGAKPIGSGWYWAQKTQPNRDDIIINCPTSWPAYIGVDNWDIIDIDNHLVGVYRTDPYDLDILQVYDPVNENFFPISQPVSVGFLGSNLLVGRGDCFTQRVFFKTLHAHTSFDDEFANFIAESRSVQEDFEKGYGVMASIVTENKYNHNMRLVDGINQFYPAYVMQDNGQFVYAFDQPESNLSNAGYQQVLTPRAFRAYNEQSFYGEETYPTRIRYTDPQVVASLIDTYRTSGTSQREDFDLQYGPIAAIIEHLNRLYSAQYRALNLHPIQERVVQNTTDGDQVITGVLQSLPAYVQRLSDEYGLQHTFGMIKGLNGIYGLDGDKRVFWRIQGNAAVDLALAKGCTGLIHQGIQFGLFKTSEICSRLDDSPLCGDGIHAGFNFQHKEVLFTVTRSEGDTTYRFTFGYSEAMEEFTHRHTIYPRMYLRVNKDFFSFADEGGQGVWLHDCDEENRNNFYGTQHALKLRFVVREFPELEKLFHSHVINSLPYEYSLTRWITQHQIAELPWATAPFWREPKYRNNRWRLSIQRQSSDNLADGSAFNVGSALHGNYLIVELTYAGSNNIKLRDVLTTFTEAKF